VLLPNIAPTISWTCSLDNCVLSFGKLLRPDNRFKLAAVEVTTVPAIDNLLAGISKVALSFILATSVPSYCWNLISLPSTGGLITASLLPPISIFK